MGTTLGGKLRHLMVAHGDMSASALAKVARVSKQTMSLWLKGSRRPGIDEAYRMARHFGVPLDWLADEAADYPPPGLAILRTRMLPDRDSPGGPDQQRDPVPEVNPARGRRR
jgi:transcriptional regulator with XRE-family HTH domain